MKGLICYIKMNNKKRNLITILGLFLLILINFILSELLIIFESYTIWYKNYDVELNNLLFLVKIISLIIAIILIRKFHSKQL